MHYRSLLLVVTSLGAILGSGPGCGDGSSKKMDGPYVETWGRQERLFSISKDKLNVTCKPKPGLGEFEFEAATTAGQDLGEYFRFTLKNYTVPKTYDLRYDSANPPLTLSVGFPDPQKASGGKDYKYDFHYLLRTDVSPSQTINSLCTIALNEEEKGSKYRYYGSVDCIWLFAATTSKDHTSDASTGYVDLFAQFDCDY